MEVVLIIIQSLAVLTGSLAALLSILLFMQLHWPSPVLWFLKLYTSALSPLFIFVGLFCALVGLSTGVIYISVTGMYTLLVYSTHIIRVTRPPQPASNFEKAFGVGCEEKIKPGLKKHFLSSRIIFSLPPVPKARLEQDLPFVTIPGTDRKLLCDIWQPPATVTPSGLAFIYLHGSAWYFLDKDLGTRPLFNHLAAQGHVIMDVAYRLAPETDMMGMISDVKRAIHWMKENAGTYQVDPQKIIVGGGSAGAHLAMMAAYTAHDPLFTPPELTGNDMGVRAVISCYGPTDLAVMYYHTNQHKTTRALPGRSRSAVPTQVPKWVKKSMGKEYYRLGMDKDFARAGTFAPLLGGHPDECPETYARFSPVSHVHAQCPPTLFIHGEDDLMAPVKTTRTLYTQLTAHKVQTVMHIIPQSDHAFDLQLPKISPSAHNAIFDMERFLALMV